MFEFFEGLLSRLRNVWDSMTLNQKVISGAVFVALLVAFAYLSTLRSAFIDYTVLFAQLDAESAQQIITRLDQQNIPYRLAADGTVIEVPRNEATQLKIQLTAEGLPSTGIVGFEILDTTTFGMSDRIQEVQIQRALQGELARALMSFSAVEWANVNLSIPEPTLFTDQEQPATAAVILRFSGSRRLSDNQIEGMSQLIASAVPGLEAGNVTIMDTSGDPLTRSFRDETAMISSTQWEYKVTVDRYLAGEAKRMLDGALGLGKALVTVNAALDWDRVERVSTLYNEDNTAVVGEETISRTTPTPDGTGQEDESRVNYEPGAVVENFVKNTGDIERLTVSVFIDRRDSTWTDADGQVQTAKVSYDDQRLASIRTIAENAVGFNQERGDLIEVVQTDFTAVESGTSAGGGLAVGATVVEVVRVLVLGIAIILGLGLLYVVLRSIISALEPSRLSVKADKDMERHVRGLREEEEIPESDRDLLVRKIVKTASDNPEIAAKTLKSLFRSE